MSHVFEDLLVGSQFDLPKLRLALGKALESGLDRQEARQCVMAHALASLGRALCLADRAEAPLCQESCHPC